jgi:hypothetical protein
MVQQLQSTVLVQIISSTGQASGHGGESMRVEVRAFVDNGEAKAACQAVASRGPDGFYTIGMRAGVQTAVMPVNPQKMIGTRIDRYV